jgi:hypothetical protein
MMLLSKVTTWKPIDDMDEEIVEGLVKAYATDLARNEQTVPPAVVLLWDDAALALGGTHRIAALQRLYGDGPLAARSELSLYPVSLLLNEATREQRVLLDALRAVVRRDGRGFRDVEDALRALLPLLEEEDQRAVHAELGDVGLAKRTTARELAEAFEKSLAEVEDAFGMVVAAQSRLDRVFKLGGDSTVNVTPYGESRHGFDLAKAKARMARDAWSIAADRMEVWRLLSEKREAELAEMLAEGNGLPEFTEENVRTFFGNYLSMMPELLKEMVAEVFGWLRPSHSRHKTNSQQEIGKKVVLVNTVRRQVVPSRFSVLHSDTQRLRALENVFSALDGHGQIGKRYNSVLEDTIAAADGGAGETRYFRFRCYANGNLHIEFMRPDLVAKLNQIAGGARLRPVRAAAKPRPARRAVRL